ncbi:hypothetical protein AN1V17_30370 [Vallitalea sediminicola]
MFGKRKNGMRFLRTRLFLDNLKSFIKGWYFRLTSKKIENKENVDKWYVISEYKIDINWREELGEVNHSRIHNMSLGADTINGTLLKPGQIFSLRKVLGEATIEKGYAQGPVFRNGKTTYTTGGGLCLDSSVLFNAVLYGNLKVLEKYNHSTDLWGEDRFVDLGRDATYVYGRKDLKFQNSTNSDVVINMGVSKEDLVIWCKIVSRDEVETKVRVEKNILNELLPDNIENVEFVKGWEVITKRFSQSENNEVLTYSKKEIYKPFVKGIS